MCAEIVALKNEQDFDSRKFAICQDVERATPQALKNGIFFFADISRNQVEEASLELLHFLAEKGEGATVSKKILSRQFPNNLQNHLELAIRRELIEEVDDAYRFQVELIRRWFTGSR